MTQRRRASKEVQALARLAADLAEEAYGDGLDAATAVIAAAIHVAFAQMTRLDVADWFRRLAAEYEATEAEAYGAKVRASLRDSTRPAAAPAGNQQRSPTS